MSYDRFKKLGVEVMTISTDTPYVHKVWNEMELSKIVPGGMPFPMLSDSNGNIGRQYGVYDDQSGMDQRGAFIIDHNGVIQMVEVLAGSVGRNTDEILRRIQATQLALSTGKGVPADWQEGDKVLDPKPQLAGHVYEVWQPEGELARM